MHHTKRVIARLCDMGCIQNTLPVAQFLEKVGCDVSLYIDVGSIAEEQFDRFGPKAIDHIPGNAVVISCLPLGDGFEAIAESGASVILIQENPDWRDARFQEWCENTDLAAVCAVSNEATDDHPQTCVTGLPAIDMAAKEVWGVSKTDVLQKLKVPLRATIVSASLPGDETGCMRMLERITPHLSEDTVMLALSHPKLKRNDPQGYERVAREVSRLSSYALEELNASINPFEHMAVARGEGYFTTTHNSSMAWQAAASGIENLFVLPPESDAEAWERSAPIITSGLGTALVDELKPQKSCSSLLTGDAVERIARVVNISL